MTTYVYAGCATLLVFIILLVAGKKGKSLSDNVFLTWMVILLLNVSTFIIISRLGYPASYSLRMLVEFSEASVFIHGPLFLLYTLSLTSSAFKIKFRHVLHFVPFAACMIILLSAISNINGAADTTRQVLTIVKMISLLVYTIAVIIILQRHRNKVEDIFSNTESKYLNWLRFLAWGIVMLWVTFSGGLLLYNFSFIHIPEYGSAAGNIALCAFIFLISYFGVKQEAVFNFVRKESITVLREDITLKTNELLSEVPRTEEITSVLYKDKYKHSSLTKEKSFELFESLKLFMLKKKPYQDSELTLYSLAKQFEIHPNHLSQLINQSCNQNFFDFVNEHRVNDVKEILLANQYRNLSLLGIAFEAGFNSKASFNRAFKKFTGMTPSEFKRKSNVNGEK